MYKITLIFIVFLFFPNYSYAYLGPGLGGGFLLASFGIIIALFATLFALIWFPIKKFLIRRKIKKQNKID